MSCPMFVVPAHHNRWLIDWLAYKGPAAACQYRVFVLGALL